MLTHSIQISCNGHLLLEGTSTGLVAADLALLYTDQEITDSVLEQELNIRIDYGFTSRYETVEVIITRISYSAEELSNA